MEILKFDKGDVLNMKKAHPCGNREFKVMRIGSDVKIRCLGCTRELILPREKIEKAIKSIQKNAD